MRTKAIKMVWISVKDFKKTIEFYRDVLGLKVVEMNEQWGWAELEGHDGEGTRLGIGQYDSKCEQESPISPGQNAVICLDVDDLDEAIADLQKKGAKLVGKIEEVPGHVRMQLIEDFDGNKIHVTQVIAHKHSHQGGCCGGH
ncbi:MAG: VOC family protein [Parachlamydiaceae bacterium]|nr:VOC family protein [Parachlamydiaceae bacterium]